MHRAPRKVSLVFAAALLAACGGSGERAVESVEPSSTSVPESSATVVNAPATSATPTTEFVAPTTSTAPAVPLQLVCGTTALPGDDPSLSTLPQAGTDEDAAWDAAAAKYGFDVRGDREWRILVKTSDELKLIADQVPGGPPSGSFTVATFGRNGGSWSPDALDQCTAQWGREGLLNVDRLEIDTSIRTSGDETTLHLVVLDDVPPCGTGADAAYQAVLDETARAVSIVVLVEPGPIMSTCPPGLVPITVQLASPLGNRALVDGSSRPGRPLTLFRAGQHLHVILVGQSVAGWWDADKSSWVGTDGVTPAFPVTSGTELQVVSLDGPQPPVVAGPPVRDCEPSQTWTISTDPAIASGPDTLAVDGTWPLLTRPVTVLSPSIPDYQRAVVDYLGQHGLSNVPVAVDQVIRVDLDGDGADEVLVAAHHPEATSGVGAQAGYFSVVLLRRVVAGGVDTVALFEDLHTSDDTDLPSTLLGVVSTIGDLNGDGVMEIAVRFQQYEGGGVDVYDVSTPTPDKVLTVGCGS